MRPHYPTNFRIHVDHLARRRAASSSEYFRDIYEVTLNRFVHVTVVPPFPLGAWSGYLPMDMEPVASVNEARQFAVASAQYVVTADADRKGTEEELLREPLSISGSPARIVVFYISPEDLAALLPELDKLSRSQPTWETTIAVSAIPSSRLATLLLSRIVSSPRLTPQHLGILQLDR